VLHLDSNGNKSNLYCEKNSFKLILTKDNLFSLYLILIILLPYVYVTIADFGYPVGFIAPKTLNYLTFQSFDFDRTR
jgi:hypothetical protein